jgi:tRNA-splicing ligase RtcB
MEKKDFLQVADNLYELPTALRKIMRVPARIYADEGILESALADKGIEQLINTTSLPGVCKYALAMPDIHQGYGPPIGGVIPLYEDTGVISPGATGYDINCGVRLLASDIDAESVMPIMENIVNGLYNAVPSGVGRGSEIKLSDREMAKVIETGSRWAVQNGYGEKDDLEHTEEHGHMTMADVDAVGVQPRSRGRNQLGSLGSGNHFLEVGMVKEIFDETVARAFGLFEGQLVVWIHTGSRGLGHQVCTEYVRSMQKALKKYELELPDRELVCAPFTSPEGQEYFSAMSGAANFAWANRQVLTQYVRETMNKLLAGTVRNRDFRLVYDIAHNIVKREEYVIDGVKTKIIIHRKGATRAFGPGNIEIPRDYREVGQPVLVPGDMGTASYIMVGTEKAEESFSSCCHGAGRKMSRAAAIKNVDGYELQQRLKNKGITVRGGGKWEELAEEAPEAYKNVHQVVNVMHHAGIARKVARTVPLGVIKG